MKRLLHTSWFVLVVATGVIWSLPLLPFKCELLFVCGLLHGRYLARWV